ncbi:DUF1990 family protein [Luethyella okanaganae]|uniref:DUF1990 family protein n=1 Tax=Luethyella okanaganae TaxID=69372 RepID=A0ABW1VH28_9MICO
MKRSTFTDQSVTYGAIGGAMAPDLMSYPPKGYRPAEHTTRLGSGAERYATASASLMTWGIQRGSGMEVTETHPGTGRQYVGLAFGVDGTPLGQQPAQQPEERFGPDGTPYITSGMTAVLRIRLWFVPISAPARVVYVIDEPSRTGFAYGTMKGHPISGEELFLVEHREDDSVWLTIRSLSRGSTPLYRFAWPIVRWQQGVYVKRYLRALHPAASA